MPPLRQTKRPQQLIILRSSLLIAAVLALIVVVQVTLHFRSACMFHGCGKNPAVILAGQDHPLSLAQQQQQQQQQQAKGHSSSSNEGLLLDVQDSPLPATLDMQRVAEYPHVDECRQCKEYPHVDECRQCKECIPQYMRRT
ncbi:hypothetical protein OEZ86_010453 [Tetradesmus obliquus]|nr:hypothetical protein OEZ86_010453 [Tetradesmus obliquus]